MGLTKIMVTQDNNRYWPTFPYNEDIDGALRILLTKTQGLARPLTCTWFRWSTFSKLGWSYHHLRNSWLVIWMPFDHISQGAKRNGSFHSFAPIFSQHNGPSSNWTNITFSAHNILFLVCPVPFIIYNYLVHIVGILAPYHLPPEITLASNYANAKLMDEWTWLSISFSLSIIMVPRDQPCPT